MATLELRDSGRFGNAAPATTPNWRNLHNIRRNAQPADPAWPARLRRALQFRRTVPSGHRRGRGQEPTQIAPDFSTTGSKAAASPPVMGSLGLLCATLFETTTRFTGSPPDV